MWQKSDLFEGGVRVPLIIAPPGAASAGTATSALVEMVDIYPTLAGLCSLSPPQHVMGRSLEPVLREPGLPHREYAFTVTSIRNKVEGRKPGALGHTIRTPQFRYTEWQEGELGNELYDYKSDPHEYVNLARVPGHEGIVSEMQELLEQARQRGR